jgi:DNA-binding transcriptional MerR regulator
MALNPNKNLKLYYSIKEVGKIIGVSESTLRFWETEIPQLKPKTLPGSNIRQYTDKDVELLKTVYTLVKVRGFKLAAARKMLNQNRTGADRSAEILDTLISVRDQLKDLKQHLDGLV